MSDQKRPKKARALLWLAALLAMGLGGLAARNHFVYRLQTSAPSGINVRQLAYPEKPVDPHPVNVLTLHGNPGSSADFEGLHDALTKRGAIARSADRPGFGYSTRPSTVLSLFEQARILHDAVGKSLERPVVVGFSYGGPVACAYAEEFPKDVRALVLVAAVGDPGTAHIVNPIQKALGWPVVGPGIAWTVGPLLAPSQIEPGLQGAFDPDPVDPKCLASALELWTSPRSLLASEGDWEGYDASIADVARRYGEIQVPVEVLVAERDSIVATAHGDYLRAHLPTARVTVVAGKNHMLTYTAAGAIVDAIDRAAKRAAEGTTAAGTK
jgi:pimeloyl-ACP methyl ester carboxylesterase